MPRVTLDETRDTLRLTEADGPRRRILIISPGQGSSGTYPADVLERDGPRAIRAGTHMYLDHPGRTEERDRPERSVRDLAAVLETDAVWDPQGSDGPGLYAEARVLPTMAPVVDALAEHIGVSIRGAGERDPDGTITSLLAVESVDFVTKAGRGGKVLELLESARPDSDELTEARTAVAEARNVGQHFESHVHLDFTVRADQMAADGFLTRDERIALSNSIGAALDAFRQQLEDTAPHLYDRDPYDQPPTSPITTRTEESTMTEQEMNERIAAAEADRDAAIEARDAALTERDDARTEADRLREAQRDTQARTIVREALTHVTFVTEAMRDDVVAARATNPPLTEAGEVDADALRTRVAEAYPTPESRVTGLGEAQTTTTPPADGDIVEANSKRVAGLFATN